MMILKSQKLDYLQQKQLMHETRTIPATPAPIAIQVSVYSPASFSGCLSESVDLWSYWVVLFDNEIKLPVDDLMWKFDVFVDLD